MSAQAVGSYGAAVLRFLSIITPVPAWPHVDSATGRILSPVVVRSQPGNQCREFPGATPRRLPAKRIHRQEFLRIFSRWRRRRSRQRNDSASSARPWRERPVPLIQSIRDDPDLRRAAVEEPTLTFGQRVAHALSMGRRHGGFRHGKSRRGATGISWLRARHETIESISLRDRRGSAPSNPATGQRPLDPIQWFPKAVGLWWGQGAKPLVLATSNELEAVISIRTLRRNPTAHRVTRPWSRVKGSAQRPVDV